MTTSFRDFVAQRKQQFPCQVQTVDEFCEVLQSCRTDTDSHPRSSSADLTQLSVQHTGDRCLDQDADTFAEIKDALSGKSHSRALGLIVKLLRKHHEFKVDETRERLLYDRLDLAGACGEQLVAEVSNAVIAHDTSSHNCSMFVRRVWFEMICNLKHPASRATMQAIQLATKLHPKALIADLVVPVLCLPAEKLGSWQCEVASRVIKETVRGAQIPALLDALSKEPEASAPEQQYMEFTDLTIPVLINLLNMRGILDEDNIARLVARINTASKSSAMRKSTKFSNLIFTMISRYPTQTSRRRDVVQRILEDCTSIMAKPALAALKKLK